MKSIVTLTSFLFVATLAVGCATADLNSEGGTSASYNAGQDEILQQLAASSVGK